MMKFAIKHFWPKAYLLTILLMGPACKPQPKPINYGHEACAYCQMGIVDRQYAAQLVSDKGKVYSFDAAECLARYRAENPETEWAHVLVTDYARPGHMVPLDSTVILRSLALPSPMGGYATMLKDSAKALRMKEKHGGTILPPSALKDIKQWQPL